MRGVRWQWRRMLQERVLESILVFEGLVRVVSC